MNEETTRKPSGKSAAAADDLASEYRFNYAKSRPNRFAGKVSPDAVVVVLDPDVAKVVRDPEQVNALLRAAIAAVGKRRAGKAS